MQKIIKRLAEIKKANLHWKSCQDGSYELNLHNHGYFELAKQLNISENEREKLVDAEIERLKSESS